MKKTLLFVCILTLIVLACSCGLFDLGDEPAKDAGSGTSAPLGGSSQSIATSTAVPTFSTNAEQDVTTAPITTRPVHTFNPKMPTVCIDSGHGFAEPGAVTLYKGKEYTESEINMQIATELKYSLEALDYNVIMLHDGATLPREEYISYLDAEKEKACFYANERNLWIKEHMSEIDLVVSIHCNKSSSTSSKGANFYITETSYSNYNSSYKLLASCLSSVQTALKLSKEPIWHRSGTLAVIKTDLPSMLVECGFMSNQTDMDNLIYPEWQKKFTSALAKGIDTYAKANIKKPDPATTTAKPPVTTAPTPSDTEAPKFPTSKPIVCIDPGHGFSDPGTVSAYNGKSVYEKDINMQIALKLKDILLQRGYNVIMTHDGSNLPESKYLSYLSGQSSKPVFYVDERIAWVNDNIDDIDLVISIHCNSTAETVTTANGSRYYITNDANSKNYKSSKNVMDKVIIAVKSSLGLAKDPTWERRMFAIFKTRRPSLLVECGFLNNPSDLEKLIDDEWQQKYATGLANGIIDFCQTYIEN